MSRLAFLLRASILSALLATPSFAQDTAPVPVEPMPPISRTVLQKQEVPGPGFESVLVLADLAPNVAVGRHSHPGPVTAYVVYGSVEVVIDGEAPRLFRAGETFMIPAGTVHDERTTTAGAKIVASFLAPAGQPLAAAAP